MQNISDIIEEFIISTMGGDNHLDLSRNDLAGYFGCAPSQINYVLATRFNLNRGYIIESQRGGGGFIKIMRIVDFDNNYMADIINNRLNSPISYKDAIFMLEDLVNKRFLSEEQAQTLSYAISPKAISLPIKGEDDLRSRILKNAFANIIKEGRK